MSALCQRPANLCCVAFNPVLQDEKVQYPKFPIKAESLSLASPKRRLNAFKSKTGQYLRILVHIVDEEVDMVAVVATWLSPLTFGFYERK